MYNRIILVGRLTADPELKQTPSGVPVTSFSLAVNRSYVPKGGERQTDFFDVVAWRTTAEFISRYFSKGKLILVEGSMESRTYVDKQGQNRRVWEMIADSAHFVEPKSASPGSPLPIADGAAMQPAPAYSSGAAEDFSDIDDDGDLPF